MGSSVYRRVECIRGDGIECYLDLDYLSLVDMIWCQVIALCEEELNAV
jgi:hypothetical protein